MRRVVCLRRPQKQDQDLRQAVGMCHGNASEGNRREWGRVHRPRPKVDRKCPGNLHPLLPVRDPAIVPFPLQPPQPPGNGLAAGAGGGTCMALPTAKRSPAPLFRDQPLLSPGQVRHSRIAAVCLRLRRGRTPRREKDKAGRTSTLQGALAAQDSRQLRGVRDRRPLEAPTDFGKMPFTGRLH